MIQISASAPPPMASPLVTCGIGGLALLMAAVVTGLVASVSRRKGLGFGIAVTVILGLQFGLARSGVLQAWARFPPPFMLMFVPTLVLTTRLAFSELGTEAARRLPWALLIGLQAFRLPLELVMHQAAREGVMPAQLSYSGWNFDILTGVSAVAVALLTLRGKASRSLIAAWNLMGSALLVAVVGIALASMPFLHTFGTNRMNTWVTYPPFVWLPGILVPSALFLHLLAWRKLGMHRGRVRLKGD